MPNPLKLENGKFRTQFEADGVYHDATHATLEEAQAYISYFTKNAPKPDNLPKADEVAPNGNEG